MNNLFADIPESEFFEKEEKKGFLFGDGGSRGNPGPSGCGGVIYDENKKILKTYKKFLGVQTNNYSEYTSLILGLEEAEKLNITHLDVFMDSKLAIEQMNGNWKVKHPQIKILWQQAKVLSENFQEITFAHVRRKKNTVADKMANEAMDEAQ